ncbi:MAG: hypothetical protein GF355_08090 [Candidatus Eisenbacteria bacterium]|nr:hypothetical protein [Candidatus Eisenbacteria bacterium]
MSQRHGVTAVVALFGVAASFVSIAADLPPLVFFEAEPWDTMGFVFVSPGRESGIDVVQMRLTDDLGNPIPDIEIVVDISGCFDLCVDPVDPGLTGVTDANGELTLDPQVGGCEDCTVIVRGNGVTVGVYGSVHSTDWNGNAASGRVGPGDLAFFAGAFLVTQDACADYTGDDAVGPSDLAVFSASFRGADSNSEECLR